MTDSERIERNITEIRQAELPDVKMRYDHFIQRDGLWRSHHHGTGDLVRLQQGQVYITGTGRGVITR